MSFNDVLKCLFGHPAPIIVLLGKPDSGKTDFALLIAQKLLELNLVSKFASNIMVYQDDRNKAEIRERFTKVTSAEALKMWLQKDTHMRKLWILDECGEHIDSRNPLSKLNKEIRYLGFRVRKYKSKIIFIIQRRKDLESTFRSEELVCAFFKKLNRKTVVVKSELLIRKFGEDTILLENVPKTDIKFDTYDIAPFELEEDIYIKAGSNPCCRVAKRYAECGNMPIIAKEMKVQPMQIKRLLQQHLKHTFKG